MAIIFRDYIGKELIDALPEITTNNIKVGTVDGGAFFYCGPVKEFYDILPSLNTKNQMEHDGRIERAESKLNDAVNNFPDVKDYVVKEFKKTKGKRVGNVMGYLNFLNLEFDKIHTRINNLEIMKNEPYLSLGQRTITDARLSADEKDTTILVIRGREVGHYWTVAEYKSGVVPNKDEIQEAL